MDGADLTSIWVYLTASKLFGLTLTLAVYWLALRLYRASGCRPWLTPVVFSIVVLVAVLHNTGVAYADYFSGAQFVHFLLGPATVALAVPLYRQWPVLRRLWWPVTAGVLGGVTVAVLVNSLAAFWLGLELEVRLSMLPKSVTTPVAMGIAERIGGIPEVTAVMVIVTGISGALLGRLILGWLKIRHPLARGVAMGVAAHGIGTARMLQESQSTGAYAGLAMGLSALVSAITLPWLVAWLG